MQKMQKKYTQNCGLLIFRPLTFHLKYISIPLTFASSWLRSFFYVFRQGVKHLSGELPLAVRKCIATQLKTNDILQSSQPTVEKKDFSFDLFKAAIVAQLWVMNQGLKTSGLNDSAITRTTERASFKTQQRLAVSVVQSDPRCFPAATQQLRHQQEACV